MAFSDVIVTGHKNPDTDAACSAVCYADFKNKLDPSTVYRGVVCGVLNPQTKFAFEKAGLPQPELLKDVYPRVSDVARSDVLKLEENEPILEAIREIDEHNVSVVPIFDFNSKFLGIIGVHEVASYFMRTNTGKQRLQYAFHVDNLDTVIPGRFLKRGTLQDISAPLMVGSMDYERTVERMESWADEKPVLIVGDKNRIIEHAVRHQFPVIVITNVAPTAPPELDLDGYTGTIYLSQSDTADTIRLMWLAAPVNHIMNPEPLVLQYDEIFDDAKKTLLASDLRGLPVLKDGQFAGVVTRRSFIEKPRRKIIMIDHNEAAQSIPGAHEADVREIIDHHRLAAEKTNAPIYVFAKPLGSSCTLVYLHYKMHGIAIEKPYAVLMLSGLLSDTLILKSPTTTDEDRACAADLARIAGIDIPTYAKEIQSKMTTLENLDPYKTASGDFKIYQEFGVNLGIAQVETVSLDGIDEVLPSFQAALEKVKQENHLDWGMLLVTDVLTEHSLLLMTTFEKAETHLAFRKVHEGLYQAPGVVSRKKQLLPEILRVVELAGS